RTVIPRWARWARPWTELPPVEPGHDLAAYTDGVQFVVGEVVGHARREGVHPSPAQLLVGRYLAGRHLDQRRPAEENLGLLVDHDGVVAHPGDVGATGRRVAKHQGDRRNAHRRELGEIAKELSSRNKEVGLGG